MKVILILAGLFLGYFNASAQEGSKFLIKGEINGLQDGVMFYLITTGESGESDTVSTVKSKNQTFSIDGKLGNEGQLFFVKMDTSIVKLDKGKRSWIRLLLTSSEIHLKGSLKQWPEVSIEGSDATIQLERFAAFVKMAQSESMSKLNANKRDSDKKKQIQTEYNDNYMRELRSISDSYAAPLFILNNVAFEIDTMDVLYTRLPDRLKKSYYGVKLKEYIANTKIGKTIVVGGQIPDFFIKNTNGKSQSIKEIVSKSKITLIDFWASWCTPCRKEIPNLKDVYSVYSKSGFNILSISIDSNTKQWEKALSQEAMPWTNALEQSNVYRSIFGIVAIPAQILVNDKFEILALDYNRMGTGSQKTQYFVKGKERMSLRGEKLSSVIEAFLNKDNDNQGRNSNKKDEKESK